LSPNVKYEKLNHSELQISKSEQQQSTTLSTPTAARNNTNTTFTNNNNNHHHHHQQDEEADSSQLNQSFDDHQTQLSVNGNGTNDPRPNRTKFSDLQIRALNDMFKQQRYPKDDQVALLGKQLGLKQVSLQKS
jgi:hypothetical protein